MGISYDDWVVGRLRDRALCRVEPGMSCIPLREDPICRACFDDDMAMMQEADSIIGTEQ